MSFLVPAFSTFSRQYFFFLSLPVCHDFIQCSNHTQLHVVLQLLCPFTTLSLGCDHPCLERPSFCLLGSFPPILETPVPNPFDLSGLIWKSLLCFPRGPHEYPCSSSCLTQQTLLGLAHCRCSVKVCWTNEFKMKHCRKDEKKGWVNLPLAEQLHPKNCNVLLDHTCTGMPLPLSLYLSAQYFHSF